MPPSRSGSSSGGSRRGSANAHGEDGSRRGEAGTRRTAEGARSLAAKTVRAAGVPDSVSGLVEQLVNRVIRPFDLVLLSRERIQETLDEAAERGRVTRSDANALVLELVQRGRQQTDDLLAQLEGLLGRGRAAREPAARRPRRAGEPVKAIPGYEELTARQVIEQLRDLGDRELREVRDHERRHANRKSVLEAVARRLERG